MDHADSLPSVNAPERKQSHMTSFKLGASTFGDYLPHHEEHR